MFEEEELLRLVEEASSLKERLQGPFEPIQNEEEETCKQLWERWKAIAAQHSEEIFQARLDLWKLPSNAWTHLGKARCLTPEAFPSWAKTFQKLMRGVAGDQRLSFVFEKSLPFQEAFYPFLNVGKRELHSLVPEMSQEIQSAFLSMLAAAWSKLFTPTLYFEFSIFRSARLSQLDMHIMGPEHCFSDCYAQFIASLQQGWKSFFFEYCVLAKLMAKKFETWLAVTQEFFRRYSQDRVDIERLFFSGQPLNLIDVKGGLSDSHRSGRSVFLLNFAHGKKLIYKPKDLQLDALFATFARWCAAESGSSLDLKTPEKLLREGYGWVEYIEHNPCQTIQEGEEFFRRAGQLLALIYALSGSDIHYENLIAHGSYPVLIDLEMLFHYFPRKQHIKNAHSELRERLDLSVLNSGLLPDWQRGLGEYHPVGGLSMCFCPDAQQWEFINTDLMKLGEKKSSLYVSNVLFLEQTPLEFAHHYEHVKSGFREMYAFLQARKETLLKPDHFFCQFQQLHNRFVFRPTSIYYLLLQKSYRPEFLRSGLENSLVFESLFSYLSDYREEHLQIFNQELEQLEEGDIPFFQRPISSETSLGLQASLNKINNLGQDDLQFQLNIIDLSVALSSTQASTQAQGDFPEQNEPSILPTDMFKEALLIKEKLLKSAHSGQDGSLCWYTISPRLLSDDKFHISVLDYDLYEGALGTALFFSALGYVTGDSSLRPLVLKTVKPALDHADSSLLSKTNFGLNGLGAYLYTLSTMGQLSDIPEFHQWVQKYIRSLSKETLLADRYYDIISGSSGCILGLLAAYETIGDEEGLAKAILCSDHLLNQREMASTEHRTWKCLDAFLTGFAHGAAGIAYALLRVYEKTNEKRFLEAALEAIEFERAVFLDEMGNWPDFRSNAKEKAMTSWCHGAPGIGLGRVGGLSIFQDQKVFEEIEIASQTTLQYGMQSDDHLCCGNCGRVEFLLTAGLRLNRPEWVQRAMQDAGSIAQKKDAREGLKGIINPCFFRGLSGIGYTFLRCAVGDRLPNVLLLDPISRN